MPPPPLPPHILATDLLSSFPPTTFAFAYGSAILPQANVNPQTRMLDLILVIEQPHKWHSQNLSLNPQHYSTPMQLLGPTAISRLQQSPFAAKVYYNTIYKPQPFKYGVVTQRDLIEDLATWSTLYLSGRMHKPIRELMPTPPSLKNAIEQNRTAATAAALLSLPERFKELEFYTAIAALSYTGDVRMKLSVEVVSKVRDIVSANMDRFRTLYTPLANKTGVTHTRADGIWTRQVELEGQLALLKRLPGGIREMVRNKLGVGGGVETLAAVERRRVGSAVLGTVAKVVGRSSVRQGIKGIATAGLGNSVRYLGAKIGKGVRSRWMRGGGLHQVQI